MKHFIQIRMKSDKGFSDYKIFEREESVETSYARKNESEKLDSLLYETYGDYLIQHQTDVPHAGRSFYNIGIDSSYNHTFNFSTCYFTHQEIAENFISKIKTIGFEPSSAQLKDTSFGRAYLTSDGVDKTLSQKEPPKFSK